MADMSNTGTINIDQQDATVKLVGQAANPEQPSGPVNNAGCIEIDQAAKAQAIKDRALSEPARHGQ